MNLSRLYNILHRKLVGSIGKEALGILYEVSFTFDLELLIFKEVPVDFQCACIHRVRNTVSSL